MIFSMMFGLFAPALTELVSAVPDRGGVTTSLNSMYSPTQSAESYIYYNAMSKCLASDAIWKGQAARTTLTYADASSGNWFQTAPTVSDGYTLKGLGTGLNFVDNGRAKDQDIKCTDTDWKQAAAVLWGFTKSDGSADLLRLLCDMGATARSTTNGAAQCDSSNNSGYTYRMLTGGAPMSGSTLRAKFQSAIKLNIGGDPTLIVDNAMKYVLYRGAFIGGCLETAPPIVPWTDAADAGSPKYYKDLKMVDESGNLTVASYLNTSTGLNNRKGSDSILAYTQPNGSEREMKCSDLAKALKNGWAEEYQAWIVQNGTDIKPENPQQNGDGPGGDANTCGSSVKLLGWVICPIITAVVALNDTLWSIIQGMLTVSPLKQNEPVYAAWGAIRSLANALFVIFFMVIIFSQLTGAGITNYGIKKMLPKIIVAAILVNVSFIIMQAAVDLSNIIGSSLYNLIHSIIPETKQYSWAMIFNSMQGAALTFVGGAAALAMVAGSATGFWLLVPFMAMALLSLVAAFLTLSFRLAAIPVLTILAPLAIIASGLPNTESWYKKWRGLLISMLMLYPMAAVIFAGAQFAASIIIGNGQNFLNYLIGLTILALPLFSLPFLAKQGGAIQGKVAGALNGLAQRARPGISGWAKGHEDAARARYQNDERPEAQTRFGRAFRRIEPRRFNRSLAAQRRVREMETEVNKQGFESQIARNEVRGVLGRGGGRTIDGSNAYARVQDSKREGGMDKKDAEERSLRENQNRINEREYFSGERHETAVEKNTQALHSEDHPERGALDAARQRTFNAKEGAKQAVADAGVRLNEEPGTLQVRSRTAAAEGRLSSSDEGIKAVIKEASTGMVAAPGSALSTLEPEVRASLSQSSYDTEQAAIRTTSAEDLRASELQDDSSLKELRVNADSNKELKEGATKRTEELIKRAKTGELGAQGSDLAALSTATRGRAGDASYALERATIGAGAAADTLAAQHEDDFTLKAARVGAAFAKKGHETAQSETAALVTEAATNATVADNPELALVDDADRTFGRTVQTRANVAASRQTQAQREQTAEYTTAILDESTGVARAAAGIGGEEAEVRVKAGATAAQSKQIDEDVQSHMTLHKERGLTSGDVLGKDDDAGKPQDDLLRISLGLTPRGAPAGTPTPSLEEQMAAMRIIHGTNSILSMEQMQNHVAELAATAPNAPETRRLQQELDSLYAKKGPTSISGGDRGQLLAGTYGTIPIPPEEVAAGISTPFEHSLFSFIKNGKFSPGKIAGIKKDELARMADILSPEAIQELGTSATSFRDKILAIQADEELRDIITDEQRAELDRILLRIGAEEPLPTT